MLRSTVLRSSFYLAQQLKLTIPLHSAVSKNYFPLHGRNFLGKFNFHTAMCDKNDCKNTASEMQVSALLEEIFSLKDTSVSNWIIESKVQSLCNAYVHLSKDEQAKFLLTLALQYAVDHGMTHELANKLVCLEIINQRQIISRERNLKNALTPNYHWLFVLMGRLEHGVKFLVDLRTDVLDLMLKLKDPEETIVLQQLNLTLRDLLLLWFSVGFLDLQRITWQSSCDMLQKISDYEAIHPMRNWADLKRRVGPYRRCYVFTHAAMPGEPLVVLHTALCDTIPSSVKGIDEAEKRILGENAEPVAFIKEDKSKIKAAIFYSIASTQKGLQNIELGNYLIKKVAGKILEEFPLVDKLSSLSPIPNFRIWLLEKMKQDVNEVFTKNECKAIECILQSSDLFTDLKQTFNNSLWTNNKELTAALEEPLVRACARYLYREKRRNYALNSVANFHLRNGAVMWRINWMADPSPRGAANSCGIMVNYRYYLKETELNSRNYIEKYLIKASESVMNLASQAEKITTKSNL